MSITSYAELQTAITNWLDRTDLSSRIPEFIALFEAKLNRRLRERQQITTGTLTPSAGSATLPSDFLEWKRLTWNGTPTRELEYVDPVYFSASYPVTSSDLPTKFTIEGSTVKINTTDATTLTLGYAQKVPSLAVTDPNWLLTSHPDGYLFGSLSMAATFTEDAQAGAVFDGMAKEIMGELWDLTFANRGPVTMKTLGPTP
jgi:hypothetical protein